MNQNEKAITEKVRASFARQDMMRALQASLDQTTKGRIVISAPILPEMHQQHGFAHAAVAFALGDSAAGYAALSMLGHQDEVLTAEMKINLLAPADGDRLVATGHVIRLGRHLVVVGATVSAEKDGISTDVAILQGTMMPVHT